MKQAIAHLALLVRDYDEALAFYTQVLGFRVIEDTPIVSEGKRWILIAPPGSEGCSLLLSRPRGEADAAMIGRQAGRRVFLFLQTDDFWRDYRTYLARGVHFCEEPRTEPYGTVAVFEDLYGNRWDLLQRKQPS